MFPKVLLIFLFLVGKLNLVREFYISFLAAKAHRAAKIVPPLFFILGTRVVKVPGTY